MEMPPGRQRIGEYGEYAQAMKLINLKDLNFSMKLKHNFLRDTFLLTIGHGAMMSKDSGTVTLNLTPSQFLPCEVETQHSWHPLIASNCLLIFLGDCLTICLASDLGSEIRPATTFECKMPRFE